MKTVLFFGAGYAARTAIKQAKSAGWQAVGTTRSTEKCAALEALGCKPVVFDGETASTELTEATQQAAALVVSIAPPRSGSAKDPVLEALGETIIDSTALEHVSYLSTIGVYGDFSGAWIDETAETAPSSERGRARINAEQQWIEAASKSGAWRIQILRLAGIYGPGRNPIERVRRGEARAIIKAGQVFNRIHVQDIAASIMAGLNGRGTHNIYNIVDDEPAPPEDVIFHAADLIGAPRPPAISFETAELTPMARSFYSDVKRVRNSRMRDDLGVALKYPTYREGLAELAGTEAT